jgi:hypothetical protein
MLKHLGQQIELLDCLSWLPAPGATEKHWWRLEPPPTPPFLKAINQLARRPYFQRLWIIQELQYANQDAIVQCGEVSVRWYYIRRALYKYRSMLPHSVIALATDLTSVGMEQLQNLSLSAKCTEPRDRVFAMMGLFPPAVARLFKPRYDIPVAGLYVQMVINTIQATWRINIHFGEDTNKSSENDRIPSGIPASIDFNDQDSRPLQVSASHASGESSAFAIHKPPHELHVSGVVHDAIEAVSGVIISSLNAKDVIRSVCECWEAVVHSSDSHESRFPTDELVWTVSMGRLRDR